MSRYLLLPPTRHLTAAAAAAVAATAASPLPRRRVRRVFEKGAHRDRIQKLARLGHLREAREVLDAMPRRSIFDCNTMISAYCNSGMLEDARSLADSISGGDMRTSTILLLGYARLGRVVDARRVFDGMLKRNTKAWTAMLGCYARNGNIIMARRLFDMMPRRGVTSWNAMLAGYCHGRQMVDARRLFEDMPERNLDSWTVMISGYARTEQHRKAWDIFRMMHRGGVSPDQSNLASVLVAVTGLRDIALLEGLRPLALKTGFESDQVIGASMLNAYTRDAGALDIAIKFFEGMPERNEHTWSTMIAALSRGGRIDAAIAVYKRDPVKSIHSRTTLLTGLTRCGRITDARILFENIPDPDVVSWNAMITGYMQNRMVDEAKELFDRMPFRNTISWAGMIAGYAQNGRSEEALDLLQALHRKGMFPNLYSLTSSFYACANIGALETGRQVHSLAVKAGCQFNSYVCNALVTMYGKCRNLEYVRQVFNGMKVKDTVSWTSYISALVHNGMMEDATHIFDNMLGRNAVSWTTIISAYAQAERGNEAVQTFKTMLHEHKLPDSHILTILLGVSASVGASKLGQQIHTVAIKHGMDSELIVANALLSMYFKCGSADSHKVFYSMEQRNIITWNTFITGCAQHGLGRQAINMYKHMESAGMLPNAVTFVGLLNACSHAGLVGEGWQFFKSMSRDYGLTPLVEHYACMVDLLGRTGDVQGAEQFIYDMPIEPDAVIWSALLGACKIHKNAEIGRRAAQKLFATEPSISSNYVMLSNIYSSLGMWVEVGEVRRIMKQQGVTKEPGCSWMQIKNKVHSFITGDKQHEQIKDIESTLEDLYTSLRTRGYVPDTEFVLHDIDEE